MDSFIFVRVHLVVTLTLQYKSFQLLWPVQLLNCGCAVFVGDEVVIAADARPNISRMIELDQTDLVLHESDIHAQYFHMMDLL